MKIITWNCNMAFREKGEFIVSRTPDILIVPEFEHPDKLSLLVGLSWRFRRHLKVVPEK